MNDLIALSIIRSTSASGLAQSALPQAAVTDDGYAPAPNGATVRRSLATTLRSVASLERRWADRLDPVAG
ncbi:hypothetical protein [Pedococcus sp. 5OH_020]|uniref:hypothetical protein n=1 Tax=Pedococcus sp. 5OH_020 TaxID=2989814 RepID=UPI0022E9A788|nr:hypothetical protein [Pedococcus sp. 5OH_020]